MSEIEQMGEIFNPKIRDEPMDVKLFNKLLAQKQKHRNYMRQYYLKNKDKYKKYQGDPNMVGKRGKNKKPRYVVSVLGDVGETMQQQNYNSLNDISLSLKLPINVVRGIYSGRYLNAKQKHTKKYLKYQIERIDKKIKRI